MRSLIKICLYSLVLILVVGVAEGVYFGWVLHLEKDGRQSDAVIVFRGSNKRIKTGYGLANKGVAPFLVVSQSSKRDVGIWNEKYGLDGKVSQTAVPQAATTFQDALYTSRIIAGHDFDTVTLVTSDYHMPRSLALMRLMLAGQGVKVRVYPVSGEDASHWVLLKLVYNEMLEFWGSLYEYGYWRVKGRVAGEPGTESAAARFLREVILIDVQPGW